MTGASQVALTGTREKTMKLSIVLSTQPTHFQAATLSGALENNLKNIADWGYQGVEFAIRDPNQLDAAALHRLVQSYGLEVPAIGTGQAWNEEGLSFTDPKPEVRSAAIERIQSHIPLAAQFNAVIIIGLIRGIVKPGVDPALAMAWLTAALQQCCRAARSAGVRLALEPINRYETTLINSAQQGLELVKAVGEDNFGLLLDTFHMNIEEASVEESIQRCGRHIFHFHVADSNRWYPGAGHLDFRSILQSLNAAGYRGYISGEFMPKPDADTAAKMSIATLKPILMSISSSL